MAVGEQGNCKLALWRWPKAAGDICVFWFASGKANTLIYTEHPWVWGEDTHKHYHSIITHSHTHAHAHTHARARTRTRTHTHTHTYSIRANMNRQTQNLPHDQSAGNRHWIHFVRMYSEQHTITPLPMLN